MISERLQRLKYLAGDFVTSSVAWALFNCVRWELHAVQGTYTSLAGFLTSRNVLILQLVIPLFMMCVYWLSGYYNEVFRKSRLQEVFTTFWSAVVNSLVIFFGALINDMSGTRGASYELIIILLSLLFFIVYAVRCAITNDTSYRIKHRKWSIPTLVVGRGATAVSFVNKINNQQHSMGYDIRGFVSIPGENDVKELSLPGYTLDEVAEVCRREHIQELIVVPTRKGSDRLLHTINHLFALDKPIKLTPMSGNVLMRKMRMSDFYGVPLVDISSSNMSDSAKNVKRAADVIISSILLLVMAPFFAIIALLIKLDSHGTVFYLQERVGYHNVPFNIYKFRTMCSDAEASGEPQLTSDNDPRVTRIGRFLRKYRIDELPQFWNVLVGDMSIVGPRPERQYYIDQIMKRAPSYALLRQVRPGITGMGMVKYGYAQNVDEMVERLDYDLMYLENMSLINDVKIMVYTIHTVLTGKGM